MHSIKNIIIAMPKRLGDALFRTPLLRLFKTIIPQVNIDVIAETQLCHEVLDNNPYIREIFLQPNSEQLKTLQNNYDLAVDVSDSEHAINCIKTFNTKQIIYHDDPALNMHTAEKSLRFVAQIFHYDLTNFTRHYDLYPQPKNLTYIKNLLDQKGFNATKEILIGFHLGCHSLAKKRTRFWNKFSHLKKAWPVENFITLAKQLHMHNPQIRIILTGTNTEMKLCNIFHKKFPEAINIVNQTSVLDLAALMHHVQLLLTNDTGTMHIACTTDTNIIALFGHSDPLNTGPYPLTSKRIILAKPAITDITPEEVLLAMRNIMA